MLKVVEVVFGCSKTWNSNFPTVPLRPDPGDDPVVQRVSAFELAVHRRPSPPLPECALFEEVVFPLFYRRDFIELLKRLLALREILGGEPFVVPWYEEEFCQNR